MILVVDDERDLRELVRAVLMLERLEVVCAANPEQARRVLADYRPQVILMDLMLSGLSGFELALEIVAVRSIPIIAFTASSFLAERAKVCPQFVMCVEKPFNWIELVELLASYERTARVA